MPPTPRRFRPRPEALSGIRPYHKAPSPPGQPRAVSGGEQQQQQQQLRRKQRRWCGSSRAGRFIRRHSDGRLAAIACEATLLHLVSTFAAAVGSAAAALRSSAPAADAAKVAGASTEEGDVRKAIALGRSGALQGGGPLPPRGLAPSGPTPVSLHSAFVQPLITGGVAALIK